MTLKIIPSGADSNLRDYSGKKPYQYFPRQDTCISSDTFRSEYKSFERGGLYSSLRHSFFKFNPPTSNEFYSETKQSSPFSEPSPGELERKLSTEKKRLPKTTSFLRELRPSIRKRVVDGNTWFTFSRIDLSSHIQNLLQFLAFESFRAWFMIGAYWDLHGFVLHVIPFHFT